jgi:hypothetical protein
MLIKSHHISLNYSGKLRVRAIQVLQLQMLLALLFVSLPSKAFLHFPQGKVNGMVSRGLPSKMPSANSTQVAAIFPFESVPSGLEIELLEEAELEDESDHYCIASLSILSSNEDCYTSSERSRFRHHQYSLHNRQTVPYFILYHSWKSYLA